MNKTNWPYKINFFIIVFSVLALGVFAGVLAAEYWLKTAEFFFNYYAAAAACGLFLAWCAYISFITLRLRLKIKKRKQDEGIKTVNDAAVRSIAEDALHRKLFVEKMADVIKSRPFASDTIRICIKSKWGEGKTSTLNMIKSELDKDPCHKVVEFNPWYYNDVESATKGFLGSLNKAISRTPPYKNLNGDFDKLLHAVCGDLCRRFLGVNVYRFFRREEELGVALGKISAAIAKTGNKYIIFIDDIDRLPEDNARDIFKVLMLASEIKGLILVLPLDVDEIIKKVCKNDPAFVEKVITIMVDLPKAPEEDLLEYFYNQIKLIPGIGITRRMLQDFVGLYKVDCLRNIKRILNTFGIYHNALRGEINDTDLLLIVYLDLFYPEIHKDIWENKEFYLAANDKEKKQKNRDHIVDLLKKYSEVEKKTLYRILATLTGDILMIKSAGYDFGKLFFSSEKRANDINYFYKYFMFSVKDKDISDVLLDKLLASWAKSDKQAKEIGLYLAKDNSIYPVFFQKIKDRAADMDFKLRQVIVEEYVMLDVLRVSIKIVNNIISILMATGFFMNAKETKKHFKTVGQFINSVLQKTKSMGLAELLRYAATRNTAIPAEEREQFKLSFFQNEKLFLRENFLSAVQPETFYDIIDFISRRAAPFDDTKWNDTLRVWLDTIKSDFTLVSYLIINRDIGVETSPDFKRMLSVFGQEYIKEIINTFEKAGLDSFQQDEFDEFKAGFNTYKA